MDIMFWVCVKSMIIVHEILNKELSSNVWSTTSSTYASDVLCEVIDLD
jgi:hypothetical protein